MAEGRSNQAICASLFVTVANEYLGQLTELRAKHLEAALRELLTPDGLRTLAQAHPGLVHLVSTVRGRLRPGVGWAELLAATFPPGSVTGAPKLAALDVIARLEPAPRGVYCGAVGWADGDRGDLNVAIRTFWVDGDRLCLGTGGAITWDSTPEGEWAETELKARRLLAVASP